MIKNNDIHFPSLPFFLGSVLLFLFFTNNLKAQNSLFANFITSVKAQDSSQVVLFFNQFIASTKDKDSVFMAKFIFSSFYPRYGDLNLLNELKGKDYKSKLDLINNVVHQFTSNPEDYNRVVDNAIILSKKIKSNEYWFRFFTAKATYAMMGSNADALSNSFQTLEGYNFEKDSMNFATFAYYKANYKKFINDSSANIYFLESIQVMRRNLSTQSDSLSMTATCTDYGSYLTNNGMQQAAIKHYNLGLKYLPVGNDFVYTKVAILKRIANAYYRLENINKSIERINEAEIICDENNFNDLKIRECYPLRGDIATREEDFGSAVEFYRKVYDMATKSGNGSYSSKLMSLKIAICFLKIGQLTEAEEWLNKSKAINNSNIEFSILELSYQTSLSLWKGNYIDAERYAIQAMSLADSTNLPFQKLSAKKMLFETYKKTKKNDKALLAYEQYEQQRDVLYRQGQQAAVEALQSDYQVSLREEKISSLNIINIANKRVLNGQKFLIIGAIVALMILTFLFLQLKKLNTKLKSQNVIITKANEEKETLLKEIHHRVKNNLQVISSLLKLQSKYIKDDNAIKAISDGRTRVQSMALLHQSLYKEDNLKGVEMKSYFENLVQSLFDTYNIEDDKIDLVLDIDDLVLDIDTVIPLGLITNELISNSLKHAFLGREHGQIAVSLKESNGKLILSVKDNGIGMNINDDIAKDSFGEMLIDSLSHKLEGQIFRNVDNGSEVVIVINDYMKVAG